MSRADDLKKKGFISDKAYDKIRKRIEKEKVVVEKKQKQLENRVDVLEKDIKDLLLKLCN